MKYIFEYTIDSEYATAKKLLDILPWLTENGYDNVTLPDHDRGDINMNDLSNRYLSHYYDASSLIWRACEFIEKHPLIEAFIDEPLTVLYHILWDGWHV